MGKINVFNGIRCCKVLQCHLSLTSQGHTSYVFEQQFSLSRRWLSLSSAVRTAGSRATKKVENFHESENLDLSQSCTESTPKISDCHVSVFHKPSKKLFLINQDDQLYKDFEFLGSKNPEKLCTDDDVQKFFKECGNSDKNPAVTTPSWNEIKLNRQNLIQPFLSLAKFRLTSFVVMTSMAGYALAPGVFHPLTLVACSAGVFLTSAAANSINQFFEVPFDSQMARTKNRPIVKGLLTPLQAVSFAVTSGSLGTFILLTGTNPLTALLGLSNIFLYTMVYTPMKRTNIANTWVGSVVGAIPPMMGWTAATGQLDAGAWLLGAVLFAWQFPHFCSLSWNLQSDYSRAGYRMMSVVDPKLCKRVALKYSLGLVGLSFLFPVCGVTTWMFAADSLPLNCYLSYLSWQFYNRGDSASSRKLFRFSLLHLPLILVLLIISKKSSHQQQDSDQSSLASDVL